MAVVVFGAVVAVFYCFSFFVVFFGAVVAADVVVGGGVINSNFGCCWCY